MSALPTNMTGQPAGIAKAGRPTRRFSIGTLIGIGIVFVLIWFVAVQIMAADRYKAVVNVIEGENKVGINPDTSLLDFGDLSRENGASRFISLEVSSACFLCFKNSEKYIMIWKFGSISELMKISKNNFVLTPGKRERIELSVYVPVSAPVTQYTGSVWVIKWPKLF